MARTYAEISISSAVFDWSPETALLSHVSVHISIPCEPA